MSAVTALILNRKSLAAQVPAPSRGVANSLSENRMFGSERTEGRRTPDLKGASWSSMNPEDRKIVTSWAIAVATFYAIATAALLLLLVHGRQASVAGDPGRSAGAPALEKALSLK
jgi:hypothetical protein